ncbi:hypothetical protein OS123_08850 [Corynebacterium sp. P5875]|uniref:Uncharacterized protein n=1 Tax=Corynebacterium antarcticum TaxID=2800405 RepID=A0A9Q4CDY4_9CORY|nr:hypothetical protein [Corynebacterium antarcticum]MCX7538640.1 hypothetical protein [Corynebacterium antarcticum]
MAKHSAGHRAGPDGRSDRWRRMVRVTPVIVAVSCILSLPFLPVVVDDGDSGVGVTPRVPTASPVGTRASGVSLSSEDLGEFTANATGSQVSFTRLSDGWHTGTATERFARPALSLIKLYIADYVLRYGLPEDKPAAVEMIRSSDDDLADELWDRYPRAIDVTAKNYGLLSTRSDEERWGYSVTSTYDVVSFIQQKLETDPMSPILTAMTQSDEFAADGYPQDFGTAVLPGAVGTKWGWSNDYSLHSSVTFGRDFVAAAAVTGSADDLTALVEAQLGGLVGERSGSVPPPPGRRLEAGG